MSDALKTSRSKLYEDNGDLLTEDDKKDDENVETVIDHTLSWMNRVAELKVGRQGHVVVVSAEDFSILAHPNTKYIGEKLYPVDEVINTEEIPDIEEIKAESISDDFHLFFPGALFRAGAGSDLILDIFDQGMVGSVFSYKDTYIICGVTLVELFAFVIIRCLISTLLFMIVAWIFCRYVAFSLGWKLGENGQFKTKLFS